MDMPVATSPAAESGTLELLLDRVMSGDALVTAGHDEGRALLDAVAHALTGSRQRAIRVSVPADGLSLSGLMAAITGRRDLSAHDDAVLELGFRALTAADDAYDGTVLLVSGADGLQRPALRYVQFACRSSKQLRVVLAGTAELPGRLAEDELAVLRARLTALPAIMPALVPVRHRPLVAPAMAVRPASVRRPVHHVSGWVAAGLGMAASLALGLWIGRSGPQPTPALAEAASQPAPANEVPVPVTVAAAPAEAVADTQPPPMDQAIVPPAALPALLPAEPAPVEEARIITPEDALPVPPPQSPPVARQARVTPRRMDTRFREPATAQMAPRATLTQPRTNFVARPPSAPTRQDDQDERPAPPPRTWQPPDDTFGPMYSSLGRPRSFIGTYSANPDGTRSFRMEP